MEGLLLIACSFISCFIIIAIIFQFMDSSYLRIYQKKYVYVLCEIVMILGLTAINVMGIAIINLLVWLLVVGIIVYYLYYEDEGKPIRRIIECEALVLCLSVCESLGVIVLHGILQLLTITIENHLMRYCLEMAFSKLVLIFLYYLGISRLLRKKDVVLSKTQYWVYVIIFGYSLINMLVIVQGFRQQQTSYLWAVNMGCIVLADLYLLYYIKMSNQKFLYEKQVKMLEQQSSIQYGYYLTQIEKYNNTIKILHDVNKHINTIESLYQAKEFQLASEYTNQINDILKPLIPTKYTGNPIMDILLTDKIVRMKEKNINFITEIEVAELNGIEPMDITTIFGNLLDNAIEAAEKVSNDREIFIKLSSYHQMIVVKIENSSDEVVWKGDVPVSNKGRERGIGLLNVKRTIEKYDGDINFNWKNRRFIVELFLNV